MRQAKWNAIDIKGINAHEYGQQAVLRNVFNQLTGMREIRVELRGEDGALLERVDLSANERVSAAGYEFYFAPNQPL